MPPKYPWQKQQPLASSSTQPPNPYAFASSQASQSNSQQSQQQQSYPLPSRPGDERPVVVSATGRVHNPGSPAVLSADSPSQLRSRHSPANRAVLGGFDNNHNDNRSYPSPTASKAKGGKSGGGSGKSFLKKKGKSEYGLGSGIGGDGKGNTKGGGGGGGFGGLTRSAKSGWTPLADDSPGPKTSGIKRYDARGYPINGESSGIRTSPDAVRIAGRGKGGMSHSQSNDSLASDVSSTGAGVDQETARFISTSNRPMSYFAPVGKSEDNGAYPPVMDYSLRSVSYAPNGESHSNGSHTWSQNGHANGNGHTNGYGNGGIYNMNGTQGYGKEIAPSLYATSMLSGHSTKSEDSLTHFKKHDHLQDNYGAFSISSKGGTRHLGNMFSLPADPATWSYLGPEADDDFHDPDIKPNRQTRFLSAMMTVRGASNLGCLTILFLLIIGLFAGYPITYQYLSRITPTGGAYNLGGINATGQIPSVGLFQLIDKDTPTSAYIHKSLETGQNWNLIFSDEFNRDGRTFWQGDDPFWQAVDLHYWQTNNLEWYSPTQVTTKNGKLVITLNNIPTNGMNYTGGMIQTWNNFCFTGGYVEAAVTLPGKNNVYGLWPAIWSLGNLGRAGYGGTLDGLWPYSYDACDVGTLANQTLNGQPVLPPGSGDSKNTGSLSYLPGQRFSRCTCPNDPTHPGPKHSDGTFVGRGAPEIDMFEAVVDSTYLRGEVSQSTQWAPFNPNYAFINTSTADFSVYNASMTYVNPWLGSAWQQATSALSITNQQCYTAETGCSSIYGYEYAPGDNGYVTWVNDGRKAWTIRGAAMAANSVSKVSQRPVPEEPMYLIMNLGISENFGPVDFDGLASLFPVTMEVDYIRVYQDPNARNIGCDPADFPTAAYISQHPEIYNNQNITVMGQIPNFNRPKNKLINQC